MKKKHLRLLGYAFLIIGIFFFINSKTNITGAIIGIPDLPSGISSILTTFFLITGLSLLIIHGRKGIEEIVEEVQEVITNQREKYKTKQGFIEGLDEIEREVKEDKSNYYDTPNAKEKDKRTRRQILRRLEKRKGGLKRREKLFFQLPVHVRKDPETGKTDIKDLPDNGLYGYLPLGGRKSKFVELDVIHYTPGDNYREIKKDFEKGERDVMITDRNGWSYFVSKPMPEKLPMKTARRIIGTGNQKYVRKDRERDPEHEIRLRIRVPKERVLVKDEEYHIYDGEKLSVKKYAIAGGISKKDIIGTPEGRRYTHKGLSESHPKRRKETWRRAG